VDGRRVTGIQRGSWGTSNGGPGPARAQMGLLTGSRPAVMPPPSTTLCGGCA
jgi:hypothetical protein